MDINWAHVLTHSLTFVYFHVLSDVLMVVLVVTTALEVLQYKKAVPHAIYFNITTNYYI